MGEGRKKREGRYGFARYYVLTVVLSFLGWCYETVYIYLRSGEWGDSGFMRLPFCPIYGCTLLFVYLLIGTPNEARGLFRRVEPTALRYALYLLIAFFIPTVMEYFVGIFFDATLHVTLWSYRGMPWSGEGYVCLPVSIVWAGLIFLVMRVLFLPLKRLIGKIPTPMAWGILIVTGGVFAIDVAGGVLKRL